MIYMSPTKVGIFQQGTKEAAKLQSMWCAAILIYRLQGWAKDSPCPRRSAHVLRIQRLGSGHLQCATWFDQVVCRSGGRPESVGFLVIDSKRNTIRNGSYVISWLEQIKILMFSEVSQSQEQPKCGFHKENWSFSWAILELFTVGRVAAREIERTTFTKHHKAITSFPSILLEAITWTDWVQVW